MDTNKKVFYSRYSAYAKRIGDLYIKRCDGYWNINAGVDPFGHDPGYGVAYDVADGTPESNQYDEFYKKTAEVQRFIIHEFGVTRESCDEIFKEIWNYIQKDKLRKLTSYFRRTL